MDVSVGKWAEGHRNSGETVVVAFKVRFPPLGGIIQKSSFNSDRKNPLPRSFPHANALRFGASAQFQKDFFSKLGN